VEPRHQPLEMAALELVEAVPKHPDGIPDGIRLLLVLQLQKEALQWINKEERKSGYLFLNARGGQLTPRGISLRLKEYAAKYGIDPSLIHPHAFRHLFARNFLKKENDIALLADLLGHSSIETTRIYLQQSSKEQSRMVDAIVDW